MNLVLDKEICPVNAAKVFQQIASGTGPKEHKKLAQVLLAAIDEAAKAQLIRDGALDIVKKTLASNEAASDAGKLGTNIYRALQLASVNLTPEELNQAGIIAAKLMLFRERQDGKQVYEFSPVHLTAGRDFKPESLKLVQGTLGVISFKDGNSHKTIELINAGSIGAILLVKDAQNRPLKVMRIISYPANVEMKTGVKAVNLRRKEQFAAYSDTNSSHLLDTGSFHEVKSGTDIHTIESLSLCNDGSTMLQDVKNGHLAVFTKFAEALKSVHDAGGRVVNVKPDSIRVLGQGEASEVKFVNPSLFCRENEIFDQFFAGTNLLRYHGDDFIEARYNPSSKYRTAEVAAKNDLKAFGIHLFQALTGPKSWLFGKSDYNSGKVLNQEQPSELAKVHYSSYVDKLLADDNVAVHIKNQNDLRNLYAWSASPEAATEIKERLHKALDSKAGYSPQRIDRIATLITDLVTLKGVPGMKVMAKTDNTAPTADWVLSEMQAISKM